jgi:hypothetical protein
VLAIHVPDTVVRSCETILRPPEAGLPILAILKIRVAVEGVEDADGLLD